MYLEGMLLRCLRGPFMPLIALLTVIPIALALQSDGPTFLVKDIWPGPSSALNPASSASTLALVE
jgi:hypothetical protein